jgi:dihydroorotate dehydrogenase electron transfer subunit
MSAALADAVEARARVTGAERAGAYRVLALRAPEVARRARPGQFVMLEAGALLRRPFSIFRARGEEVAVAFDVVGEGTRWLAARRPGDELALAGPLGTGFSLDGPGPVVAVGGGYGAAPLFFLAKRLRPAGVAVHALLGAATADRLLGAPDADRAFDSATIVTEDGSAGRRGIATDPLPELCRRVGARRVAACGPMPMLAAVARVAAALGVPAEVAAEEYMACGIGVCWTCVVPLRRDGATVYERACTEGPVFPGEAVAWG